jgi:hypothetical protein
VQPHPLQDRDWDHDLDVPVAEPVVAAEAPFPPAAAPGALPSEPQPPRTRPRHRGAADREATPPPFPQVHAAPLTAAAVAGTAAVAALDLALTGRLSMFFDLCFVLVGLVSALTVRRPGMYAVGVQPPLLMGAVVALLAVVQPTALTVTPSAFVSTWLTGLAHHGAALAVTHLVVLAVVGARVAPRR